MRKIILQCSLLSYFDTKQYTPEEISKISLLCQKAGASVVHVHVNRFESMDEFMRMARILEEQKGPALNLSISDYKEVVSWKMERPSIIRFVAMQGADCRVFGSSVTQSLEKAKAQMKEYLENNFVPEVVIFNKQGVKNCLDLNCQYPQKFYTSVHLGYPDEMPATKEVVSDILEQLKACKFISFNIYNNQDDELFKHIIRYGGQIRSGMEDSEYCGKRKAIDSIDSMKHISKIAKLCGYEPVVDVVNDYFK